MIRSHPLSVPFFFLLPALGGCPISSDGPGGGPGGPGGGQPMGLDLAQAAPQFTQDQVRAGEHVRISGTVVGSECTGRIRIDFIDRSVSGPGGGKGAGPGGGQGQGMGPGGGQGQGMGPGGGQGQGMGPGGGQGQGMGAGGGQGQGMGAGGGQGQGMGPGDGQGQGMGPGGGQGQGMGAGGGQGQGVGPGGGKGGGRGAQGQVGPVTVIDLEAPGPFEGVLPMGKELSVSALCDQDGDGRVGPPGDFIALGEPLGVLSTDVAGITLELISFNALGSPGGGKGAGPGGGQGQGMGPGGGQGQGMGPGGGQGQGMGGPVEGGPSQPQGEPPPTGVEP